MNTPMYRKKNITKKCVYTFYVGKQLKLINYLWVYSASKSFVTKRHCC